MKRTGLAAAWLLAALVGCSSSNGPTTTGPEPVQPPPPLTTSIKVAADDPALLDGAGATKFRLSKLRFLQLRLQTPDFPAGVSWVTMKIYTPYGALYHTRHVPYSTDPSIKQVDSPDGVPHPIDVVQAAHVPGGYGLDTQVLVGGSNMVRRPIPGLWRVTMQMDGRADIAAETTLDFGAMP